MGIEKVSTRVGYIQYRKLSNRKFEYSIKEGNTKRNRKGYSERLAQQRAMYLADKFKNPQGMKFYLKCAWNLTDNYIDWLVEYSFKKNNPSKYFVYVASRKMQEIM